jgi:hypothetical protein
MLDANGKRCQQLSGRLENALEVGSGEKSETPIAETDLATETDR